MWLCWWLYPVGHRYGYQNKNLHMISDHCPHALTKLLSIDAWSGKQKARHSLGSCHWYLDLWQDLKTSIYYVNHALFVRLRLMRTFKNVFKILIVQVSFGGRTLKH